MDLEELHTSLNRLTRIIDWHKKTLTLKKLEFGRVVYTLKDLGVWMKSGVMSEPLVSVVFPVYNGERLIKSALKQILLQTHKNIEIIFSDNSSSDTSRSILNSIAKESSNIKIYYQQQNLGAMSNVNFLFSKAQGKYILLAALDDYRSQNYIAEMVKVLEDRPDVALCIPQVQMILANENTKVYTINDLSEHQLERSIGRYYQTLFSFPNVSWYGIYRASMLKKIPPIPDTFAGDLIFIQMLSLIGKFKYCEAAVLEFVMKEKWNTKSMDARFFYGTRKDPRNIPRSLIVLMTQIRTITEIRIPIYEKMAAMSMLCLFEMYKTGLKMCKLIIRNLPLSDKLKLKVCRKFYFRVMKPSWITVNDPQSFELREIRPVLGIEK